MRTVSELASEILSLSKKIEARISFKGEQITRMEKVNLRALILEMEASLEGSDKYKPKPN